MEEVLGREGRQLAGTTFAVQGFGNVGSTVMRLLHDAGATVVAIADIHDGLYNAGGNDVPQLIAHVNESGSVVGFRGAEPLTNAELLELSVDILVPAAYEGQITAGKASRIRDRVVAEAANDPTTPEVDRILEDRGIQVIPDILCKRAA